MAWSNGLPGERKSTGAAYLLWFFCGGAGAHKFYLGRPGIGVLYGVSFGLFGIGLLVDVFTIPSQVRRANASRGGETSRSRKGWTPPVRSYTVEKAEQVTASKPINFDKYRTQGPASSTSPPSFGRRGL